jgi:hypothetical protein
MRLLALALVFFATTVRGETLVLLSKCERKGCLIMDLSTSGPPTAEKKRVLKNLREELTFSVRGKSGSGPERSFQVIFHRKPGLPECQGLGPVAVLGIKDDHPILSTNAGPIEVTDGSLVVGCTGCVRVVDPKEGKTVAEPPSPSRDLSHFGYSPGDFTVEKSGTVWLRVDEASCVKLARDGLFSVEGSGQCSRREAKLLTSTPSEPAASPSPAPTPSAEAGASYSRYEAGRHELWISDPGC